MEMTLPTSILTKKQAKTWQARINYHGTPSRIVANVRHDDECGNGHNTFSITGDIYAIDRRVNPSDGGFLAGGCVHEEIAKAFPGLAPLIKWHLCSTDQPMHYVANVVYLAGERDCWGLLKGEPRHYRTSIQFGQNPIKHHFAAYRNESFMRFLKESAPQFDLEVIAYQHDRDRDKFGDKYTFGGYANKWHECPFDTEEEALDFLAALQTCSPQFVEQVESRGEGKARELAAARSAAIWPEATDEDLTAPGLKERLEARLPALMEEFKAAVESIGFVY